jgi:hypothetical protein
LENADQVAQIIADGESSLDALAEDEGDGEDEDEEAGVDGASIVCGRILMWLGPQGDLEQNKGHTGSFYEIRTLTNRRMLEIFLLSENGRRVQRRLVFSSDTRFSLADLPASSDDRDSMQLQGMKHSGGNVFENVIDQSGAKARRAGAGDMYGAQVGSLTIRRRRAPSVSEIVAKESLRLATERWGETTPVLVIPSEWDYEEIVPDEHMCGLLPSALIEQYQFWRTGDSTIRGYPYPNRGRSDDATTTLLVILAIELKLRCDGSTPASSSFTAHFEPTAVAEDVWSALEAQHGDSFTAECQNGAGVSFGDAFSRSSEETIGAAGVGSWVATAHRFVVLDSNIVLTADGGAIQTKEDEAAALALQAESYPPPTLLLNLLRARLDSPLYTLGLLLSRIENVSNILVWSHSAARPGEEAAISLVELPRLKTRFKCENGRLESLDYSGSYL